MRRALGLFFVLSLFFLFAGAASGGVKGSVALIVIDADSYVVQRAVSGLELPEGFTARAFCMSDLASDEAARFLRDSSVIVVDVMDNALSQYIIDNGLLDGRKVLALRGSQDDVSLKAKGFLFDEETASYYSYLRPDNVQNMLKRALVLGTGAEIAYDPVRTTPDNGLYHPEAGVDGVFTPAEEYLAWYRSAPNQPWLGLMFFSTSLADGQREAFDGLIGKLERSGFNVLPAFGKDQTIIESYFMDEAGNRRVDAVLSFSLKFYMSLNKGLAQSVASLDVPIFNAINMYSAAIDEWQKSEVGIPALDVIWTMATPEISGVIEPTPLMGKVKERGANGGTVYRYEPIPGMIERLVPRIHNWIKLRKTPNAEKKIAILYYNNSQGKQNIGASYLNVFRSLEEILDGMKRAGYGIPSDLKLDEEEIKGLVLRGGRNIGSWAPGELDVLVESAQVVKLPLSRYKEWLAELPEDFRARVTEQYGDPAASDLMIKDGNIIIPVVRAGSVVLLPEPARGAADDPMKLYHDPLLYPHPQYLAAYLWLEKEFGADAMVHLGTHATYEWMPGKQAGLSLSCPPEVLITNIPNVYPYIVDDVGEGIQAKRRGRGVVIDHLTPALTVADGYGEYAELSGFCADYRQAASMGAATAESYLEKIRAAAAALGLNKDLGLGEIASADVPAIAQYLEYLDGVYVPYGLHTFGRSPDGEQTKTTVGAVIEQNPDLDRTAVADKLKKSGPEEMSRFLRALEGRYVPPAEGNDPVRNPAAVPTGRNFYGLSPNRLPTPEAWTLGQKAAKEIVEKYIDERGVYPDKVAVVLWAVESLRNEGLNESTILSLIGVEPVWGPTGIVTGTRPIPAARLGRPRVDVTVDVSGLYRDLFPDKVLFIDAAIRQAAVQDDIENFIRRNDQRIKEKLIEAGMSEKDAGRFSKARVFSEAPGAYGNRVEELVSASGLWEDESAVAEVFRRHTGYAYGVDFWGAPAEPALAENLRDAKVAWHSVSSQYYGLMDNDDMFMYLGGLSMAIRDLSGAPPRTMIADQRTLGGVKMEELSKFLGAEMRSRYLNPKWIEGMKAENYAGAREMSNYVEYLWGWQVTTPGDVDESAWEQTYQVYVEDKYGMDIKNFMDENNPWAYQSLTGRMLETVRKGYWNASEEIRRKLAVEYAVSVVNRGLACCDHTCNNPQFHQMVMNLISIPGLMSPEMVAEFKLAVEKAGQKTLEEMTRSRENLLKNLGESRPSQTPQSGLEADSPSQSVKGFKMENVENAETSAPSSGVEWFASLFVLAFLALFYIGLRRGKQ